MQKTKTDMNDASDTNMEWAKTNYGFRSVYLLFPFIPTWLVAKSFFLLLWHIVSSCFEHDDNDLASVYTEDRSNRVAFLILLAALLYFMQYLTSIS